MKKNGFMLAEVLIVSTLLIGVMVFMYTQIRTLTSNYDKTFKYNTVDGLYGAKVVYDFLLTENEYNAFNTTSFIDRNKLNKSTYFDALVEELGILKIVVSNDSDKVYNFLTNNYSNADGYDGSSEYYESFITFSTTLNSSGKHIIIAYNDGTFCDYKF